MMMVQNERIYKYVSVEQNVQYTIYVVWIWLCYSDGLLFRKFTISTNSKADPNPNPNFNLSPNLSTVVRICTMDLWNSGPLE